MPIERGGRLKVGGGYLRREARLSACWQAAAAKCAQRIIAQVDTQTWRYAYVAIYHRATNMILECVINSNSKDWQATRSANE